jgi:hypothetical protein
MKKLNKDKEIKLGWGKIELPTSSEEEAQKITPTRKTLGKSTRGKECSLHWYAYESNLMIFLN